MGTINETVRTASSALRTLLLAILVIGSGIAGWKGYSLYNEPQKKLADKEQELKAALADLEQQQQQIKTLNANLQAKAEQLERTETSLRLVKLRRRIARLQVLDQKPIPDSDRVLTTVEFFEMNNEGTPIDESRKKMEIEGDRVYVECLVAKFEDKYVEQADIDRATAICLFQRVFGEHQKPIDGFELDQSGTSPTAYERGGKMSNFEKRIWEDFWDFAQNPQKAAEIGIRAAHADAPSLRVEKGKTYIIKLGTTGGISFEPLADGA